MSSPRLQNCVSHVSKSTEFLHFRFHFRKIAPAAGNFLFVFVMRRWLIHLLAALVAENCVLQKNSTIWHFGPNLKCQSGGQKMTKHSSKLAGITLHFRRFHQHVLQYLIEMQWLCNFIHDFVLKNLFPSPLNDVWCFHKHNTHCFEKSSGEETTKARTVENCTSECLSALFMCAGIGGDFPTRAFFWWGSFPTRQNLKSVHCCGQLSKH